MVRKKGCPGPALEHIFLVFTLLPAHLPCSWSVHTQPQTHDGVRAWEETLQDTAPGLCLYWHLLIKPYSFVAERWQCQATRKTSFLSPCTPLASCRERGGFGSRLDRLVSVFLEAIRTIPQGEAGFAVVSQPLRAAQGPESFRKGLARITEERFPGSPLVETLHFYCRGHRFNP